MATTSVNTMWFLRSALQARGDVSNDILRFQSQFVNRRELQRW